MGKTLEQLLAELAAEKAAKAIAYKNELKNNPYLTCVIYGLYNWTLNKYVAHGLSPLGRYYERAISQQLKWPDYSFQGPDAFDQDQDVILDGIKVHIHLRYPTNEEIREEEEDI